MRWRMRYRSRLRRSLQYLIKDLFEDITIFSNRTLDATAQKRADGKYDVTIKVETRKYKADAKGNETEVPVNDYIDIGAFAKPAKARNMATRCIASASTYPEGRRLSHL